MRIIKVISVLLFLAVFGAGYAYASVVRLALIDYAHFRNIGANVYLSTSVPEGAEQKIISLLEGARKRIAVHYGEPAAAPVTVILGHKREQERYGLSGHPGTFLFAPWGNYLLLDYETANIDVTAHELVHAEIVNRVGYIRRQFDIPTWFDEGAAMQVDYRQKYTSSTGIDQAGFSRLVGLDTPGKFWSSDRSQNINNYQSSKAAVAALLKHTDESLYSLLEKVRHGEDDVIAIAASETNKALQRTSR